MRFLVVGDSPDFEADKVSELAGIGDCLIALDGAALKLPPSTVPDIICGDFDSLDLAAAQQQFPQAEFLRLEDQYENDLEKALKVALSRGGGEILLCCIFGGMPDQHAANMSVMVRYHRAASLRAFHRGMECQIASPDVPVRLMLSEGDEVSTIPVGAAAQVSLSGVRWPLVRETLQMGSHGVSNVALGGEVCVEPHCGEVMVFAAPRGLRP